jgi:hypothetical protein
MELGEGGLDLDEGVLSLIRGNVAYRPRARLSRRGGDCGAAHLTRNHGVLEHHAPADPSRSHWTPWADLLKFDRCRFSDVAWISDHSGTIAVT